LLHASRAGRSPQQIGRKGLSNPRGIVGGKRGRLVNQCGLVVGGDGAAAPVAAKAVQGLLRRGDGGLLVLSETACQAAEGDPAQRKLGPRGAWEDRRLVETGLSRLTVVCHCQRVRHRGGPYFYARLACTMAAFNVLDQWHG
jgi:hypothetical protein